MNLMKFVIVLLFVASCSKSDDAPFVYNTLEEYADNRTTEMGAVIACAAKEENTNAILTFFYPEEGASNIQCFETEDATVANDDFGNYTRVNLDTSPFFNGYLRFFTSSPSIEKWIVVTFELDGEIKISNPIRTRQLSKPTVWNDAVTIDHETPLMPKFSWEANALGDNAIYFQVISNVQGDLLSGTYTHENQFQYYDTSNVVLNITEGTPPELTDDLEYNFTLMDVSLDNWVNLVTQKSFTAE